MPSTDVDQVERQRVKSRYSLHPALWALAACTFAVGTGEFVVAGLLLSISSDLKVSLSVAGLLVSGYALGVVAGAPLMIALAGRMQRKATLLTLIGMFIAGNLLCVVAPNYDTLLAARAITGLCHAPLFGLGSVIAAELVPKGKQAAAIASMFIGVTLANLLGVPLGILLGQTCGWRFTFLTVALLGLCAAVGIARLVPNSQQHPPLHVSEELRALRHPQIVLAFLMTMLGFGSIATVLTYITPILITISHFSQRAVSPILLLFGVGFVVGNTLGGKLADRYAMASLMTTLASLAAILAAFSITSHYPSASIVTVFLFGTASFALVPGFQLRVVSQAEGAPSLASVVNIAAFNLGSAGGAVLGGIALNSTPGIRGIPLIGALVAMSSLLVAFASWFLEKRGKEKLP